MKIKLFSTICILFTIIIGSYGQTNIQFQLLPSTTRVKMNSSNISKIEVDYPHGQTDIIGIIPSQEPDVRDNLVVTGGIQKMLQSFIESRYEFPNNNLENSLLWSINNLNIGIDSSDLGKISYVKMEVNISIKNNQNVYKIAAFDTLIFSKNQNAQLESLLVDGIEGIYNKSILSLQNRSINNLKLRSSSLNANNTLILSTSNISPEDPQNWPIFVNTGYLNGVYLSFQEFKDNAPSVKNFFTGVDSTTGKIGIFELNSDSSTVAIQSPWGICVGNELYKFSDGELYAIEKGKSQFLVSKYLDFRTRKNQALFWRQRLGNSQNDNNPFDDRHIFRAAIDKGSSVTIEATKLDNKTGELTF